MDCVNCGLDLPKAARFCLNCGAAQPNYSNGNGENKVQGSEVVAESEHLLDLPTVPLSRDFDWLEREAILDPNIDYAAARQYQGAAGQAMGCLGYLFFGFIALLALLPGIPLLAIFGLPAAIILGLLTFFNVGKWRERWGQISFFKKVPGLNSSNAAVLSVSITAYLAVLSGLSILLLVISSRR